MIQPCNCEESQRLGWRASIRSTRIQVPLAVSHIDQHGRFGERFDYQYIVTCAHCDRVLKGVNYNPLGLPLSRSDYELMIDFKMSKYFLWHYCPGPEAMDDSVLSAARQWDSAMRPGA